MKSTPASAVRLGDYSTDRRVLVLSAMAVIVGGLGAVAARALDLLIVLITNLCYFGRFSFARVSPAANALGIWSVLVPVGGGLVIGAMAR